MARKYGPSTPGSDLLYTKTERKAFAAYTQWAWDINEDFLTTGFATHLTKSAEENLFRYQSLLTGNAFNALIGGNALPAFGLPALRAMADGTPIADIDASPIRSSPPEWRPD